MKDKENQHTSLLTFGERLDYFLRSAHITRANYAEILEVSGSSVSNYISDRQEMKYNSLLKTYNLGCDLTWLLTGEGVMFAKNQQGKKLAMQETQYYDDETEEELRAAHERYALVRQWLTVTGSIEEYWMKCREVQPEMTLNEVLALEGRAVLPERGLREQYYLWLIESGINIDWLIGGGEDAEEPFTKTPEGKALLETIIHRIERKLALMGV